MGVEVSVGTIVSVKVGVRVAVLVGIVVGVVVAVPLAVGLTLDNSLCVMVAVGVSSRGAADWQPASKSQIAIKPNN